MRTAFDGSAVPKDKISQCRRFSHTATSGADQRVAARVCLSLLLMPFSLAVKDVRHSPTARHQVKMDDFFGERGRENGYFESDAGVPPGDAHSQGSHGHLRP